MAKKPRSEKKLDPKVVRFRSVENYGSCGMIIQSFESTLIDKVYDFLTALDHNESTWMAKGVVKEESNETEDPDTFPIRDCIDDIDNCANIGQSGKDALTKIVQEFVNNVSIRSLLDEWCGQMDLATQISKTIHKYSERAEPIGLNEVYPMAVELVHLIMSDRKL